MATEQSPRQFLQDNNLLRRVGLERLKSVISSYENPLPLPLNEFVNRFRRYRTDPKAKAIETVYGAMTLPEGQPSAYAFIDIDEVLRGTAQAVRDFEEAGSIRQEDLADVHEVASGLSWLQHDRKEHLQIGGQNVKEVVTSFAETKGGALSEDRLQALQQFVRRTVTHHVLSNNLAPPDENIKEIAALIRNWREKNIYIAGITASRQGTEAGTLAFLEEHLPECFDALLFCGKGQNAESIDKGIAAKKLLDAIPDRNGPVNAVLIDDVSFNTAAFKKELQKIPGSRVATIIPEVNTHLPVHAETQLSGNSLMAFTDANQYLTKSLEASNAFDISRAPEWLFLQHSDMHISPEAISQKKENSFNYYPEERKTNLSIMTLHHIYEGGEKDWQKLTEAQDPNKRLSFETFKELHKVIRFWIQDEETYEAMMYVMLIHDIGKNPDIMRAVGLPETGNHDEALRRLLSPEYEEQRKQFLQSLANPDMFSSQQKAIITQVLSLDFNFSGFAQSQCSLEEVNNIQGADLDILALHTIHGILDTAGARTNHEFPLTSSNLTEATTIRFLDAMYAVLVTPEELGLPYNREITGSLRSLVDLELTKARLIDGEDGVDEQSYERFLIDIGRRFQQNEMLTTDLQTQLQLAKMLRVETPDEFREIIPHAYDGLPFILRRTLDSFFLSGGSLASKLLSLDYGPALIRTLGINDLNKGLGTFIQILANACTINAYNEMNDLPSIIQLDFKELIESLKVDSLLKQVGYRQEATRLLFTHPNKEDNDGTFFVYPNSSYDLPKD